jgi:hypothetical protein
MEFRVVEMHYYEVEADSIEEAEDLVYDQDLKPTEVDTICQELDVSYVLKEDEDALTPAEYNDLRRENADWLAGKEK